MKIQIFFMLSVYTIPVVSLKLLKTEDPWEEFKRLHRRNFENQTEDSFRKTLFQKKLEMIKNHNKRYKNGLETYSMRINQFSDFTEEELGLYTQSLKSPPKEKFFLSSISANFSKTPPRRVPESFNWRDAGMITAVKNQGNCGSCWAFSTTGALEANYKIYYGRSVSLSEQQLIDCVPEASGCFGGWMSDAYDYILKNKGISFRSVYPYRATDEGYCRYESSKFKIVIKGYASLANLDEEILKEILVNQGPVSVAFDSTGNFANYGSGVYYNPSCSDKKFTHAVVIVGYGRERGLDFWLVKNSWGVNWGLDGYFKIARNKNNHCGIASKVSYPVF